MRIATNPTLIMTPDEYDAIVSFCQNIVSDLSSLSNDDIVGIIANIAETNETFTLWDSETTISVRVSEDA